MNPNHELLFLIADEFLQLTDLQQLNVGVRLGLIDFGGFCRTPQVIQETVFRNAYKRNMLAKLVVEIGKAKHEPKKQD